MRFKSQIIPGVVLIAVIVKTGITGVLIIAATLITMELIKLVREENDDEKSS